MSEAPASPCVSICALDGDDVCVGCFRTGREISYWGRLAAAHQHEVLARCRRRMNGEGASCLMAEVRSPTQAPGREPWRRADHERE